MNETRLETKRNDFIKDVVTRLVEERKNQGISQEELNGRLGVADRLLGKWEVGVRQPTAFNLYCWADSLNMKLTVVSNNYTPPAQSQTLPLASNDNRLISLNLTLNASA